MDSTDRDPDVEVKIEHKDERNFQSIECTNSDPQIGGNIEMKLTPMGDTFLYNYDLLTTDSSAAEMLPASSPISITARHFVSTTVFMGA